MSSFTITTDANADFATGYAKQHGISEFDLSYTLDGKTYLTRDPACPPSVFYAKMRSGLMPKTAAVNPEEVAGSLEQLLREGQDILHLSFSSALSASHNNVLIAVDSLREKYPERKMFVIDTLCAAGGQGMLVGRAVDYREEGLTLEQTVERVHEDIPHMTHLFTVEDLFHLHRGGRVSAASAVVGSMLGIKPVLHMDDEGRLIPVSKVRGRRQSLLALVAGMEKQWDPAHCDRFAISHGDCLEDAQFVADEIVKRLHLKTYTIAYVGATVGTHSGPGTVALFFYGKNR